MLCTRYSACTFRHHMLHIQPQSSRIGLDANILRCKCIESRPCSQRQKFSETHSLHIGAIPWNIHTYPADRLCKLHSQQSPCTYRSHTSNTSRLLLYIQLDNHRQHLTNSRLVKSSATHHTKRNYYSCLNRPMSNICHRNSLYKQYCLSTSLCTCRRRTLSTDRRLGLHTRLDRHRMK